MSMADDTRFDHLITPEEWGKIEAEREKWREKAIEAGNRAHAEAMETVEQVESLRIDWDEVAEVIQGRHDTHPGEWVRVRKAAKTPSAAENVNAGRIDALSWVDAESIARPSEPGASTFEVFVRVAVR